MSIHQDHIQQSLLKLPDEEDSVNSLPLQKLSLDDYPETSTITLKEDMFSSYKIKEDINTKLAQIPSTEGTETRSGRQNIFSNALVKFKGDRRRRLLASLIRPEFHTLELEGLVKMFPRKQAIEMSDHSNGTCSSPVEVKSKSATPSLTTENVIRSQKSNTAVRLRPTSTGKLEEICAKSSRNQKFYPYVLKTRHERRRYHQSLSPIEEEDFQFPSPTSSLYQKFQELQITPKKYIDTHFKDLSVNVSLPKKKPPPHCSHCTVIKAELLSPEQNLERDYQICCENFNPFTSVLNFEEINEMYPMNSDDYQVRTFNLPMAYKLHFQQP